MEIKKYKKETIQSSQDTFELIQKVFFRRKKVDRLKEHFWTIALNKASKIVLVELVSIGSNGRTVAGPQEILRLPLYKVASYLILIHNHPSGNLKPSEADLNLTDRIIQAGNIMGIEVIDHVIVTENSYYSFEESGLMDKLRLESKYALTFVQEKQMAKEVEKIKKEAEKKSIKSKQEGIKLGEKKGEEKGIKARNKEIAKNLLRQGIDIEVVKQATGLTVQWLGRLKNEIESINEYKYNGKKR